MAIRDERPQHEMSPMIALSFGDDNVRASTPRSKGRRASYRKLSTKSCQAILSRSLATACPTADRPFTGYRRGSLASTVTPSDCNHTSHTLLDNCHGACLEFRSLMYSEFVRITYVSRSLSTMLMKRFSPVGSGEVLGRILSTFHFKIIAISCEFVIFGSMSGSTLHKYSRYSQSKAKSVLILSQNTAISTCRGRSMKDDE